MPRKSKEEYNAYMRKYLADSRRRQKEALDALKFNYPQVYERVFGKKKK
jgi:hypothetical protein